MSKKTRCEMNNFHTWSDEQGSRVESAIESYEEMEVIFKCIICGAEGEGIIQWN